MRLIDERPEVILKREILISWLKGELESEYISEKDRKVFEEHLSLLQKPNSFAVESSWDYFEENGEDFSLQEAIAEFRESGTDTGLDSRFGSRHYERKEVAHEIAGVPDIWIGWTYWYGGGKHGEPEAVEWISDAYFLESTIEMQPVRKFTKVEPEPGARR